MLRYVTVGLASSILAAACALVEPPPQADMVTLRAEVRNASRDRVELTVSTDRPLPGAVQPASVAPESAASVILSVPIEQAWTLEIGGETRDGDSFGSTLEGWAIESLLDQGCEVVIDLWENNGRNVSCSR